MLRITIFFLFFCFNLHEGTYHKVLLTELKTLTLYRGEWTTSRRSTPVLQLNCIGGSAMNEFTPPVVQCYNKGTDGYDIQWKCEADMSSDYRFGRMEVNCEGYDYPEDRYVLVGSCGLEYTLELTEAALKRRGQSWGQWNDAVPGGKSSISAGVVLLVLLVLLVASLAVCFYCRTVLPYVQSGEAGSAPYAGPPGPPPPGFRPEFSGPQARLYPSFDSSAPQPPPYSAHESAAGSGSGSQAGGPGFWTGATTGGLLGFLFGRWSGGGQPHPNAHWWGGQPRTWGAGNWGSSGGYASSDAWYGGPHHTPTAGAASSSDPGDSHTTSGYARTRRR